VRDCAKSSGGLAIVAAADHLDAARQDLKAFEASTVARLHPA
jgi:hypothetical protein